MPGATPEVLRLAELVASCESGHEAAIEVMREEALSLRREIVTATTPADEPPIERDARIGTFTELPDRAFDGADAFVELAGDVLQAEMWDPAWGETPSWQKYFDEAWKRLLIRLAVAERLVTASASELRGGAWPASA